MTEIKIRVIFVLKNLFKEIRRNENNCKPIAATTKPTINKQKNVNIKREQLFTGIQVCVCMHVSCGSSSTISLCVIKLLKA